MLGTALMAGAASSTFAEALSAANTKPVKKLPGLLHFGVMGDGGSGDKAQFDIAKRMVDVHRADPNDPWKFVLTMGDNVYENGEPEHFDSRYVDVYRPLLEDNVPVHCSLGNHDVRHRNGMDQVEEEAFGFVGKQDEYEFAAGPQTADGKQLARFICLNSTRWIDAVDEDNKKELVHLRGELRERLAEVDRYRWNILYMHHPIHSYIKRRFGIPRGHGSSRELQAALEPILFEHGVDLVLAGHEHFYQKIRPKRGVHHLITGGAGKLRSGVKTESDDVAFGAVEYHFMDMALDENELHFQAIDDQGRALHSGRIEKPRKIRTEKRPKAA